MFSVVSSFGASGSSAGAASDGVDGVAVEVVVVDAVFVLAGGRISPTFVELTVTVGFDRSICGAPLSTSSDKSSLAVVSRNVDFLLSVIDPTSRKSSSPTSRRKICRVDFVSGRLLKSTDCESPESLSRLPSASWSGSTPSSVPVAESRHPTRY